MRHTKFFAFLVLVLTGIGASAFPSPEGQDLNTAAHELYKSDVQGALELFQEAAVGKSHRAVDAFRMVGQIEFNLGHIDASIEAYRDGLTALNSWNSDTPFVTRQRVELLGKLAQSLSWRADEVIASARSVVDPAERDASVTQARKLSEEAVHLRGQLLDIEDLHKLVRSESIETYMLAQGRQLLDLKRHQEALLAFRRFQETFPRWGWDDGQIVQLRFDIVRSMRLDQVQYVRALEGIWYDPELQEFDLLAMIGNNIVVRYMAARRHDDVRRVNNEVLEFIEAHPKSVKVANVNVHAQQLLIKAALLEVDGDVVGAREIYQDVRDRFPASTWATAAQQKIDDLVDR